MRKFIYLLITLLVTVTCANYALAETKMQGTKGTKGTISCPNSNKFIREHISQAAFGEGYTLKIVKPDGTGNTWKTVKNTGSGGTTNGAAVLFTWILQGSSFKVQVNNPTPTITSHKETCNYGTAVIRVLHTPLFKEVHTAPVILGL